MATNFKERYKDNKFLSSSEKKELVQLLSDSITFETFGKTFENFNFREYSCEDYRNLLEKYGPVWITIDSDESSSKSQHAIILCAVSSLDSNKALLKYYDVADATIKTLNHTKFNEMVCHGEENFPFPNIVRAKRKIGEGSGLLFRIFNIEVNEHFTILKPYLTNNVTGEDNTFVNNIIRDNSFDLNDWLFKISSTIDLDMIKHLEIFGVSKNGNKLSIFEDNINQKKFVWNGLYKTNSETEYDWCFTNFSDFIIIINHFEEISLKKVFEDDFNIDINFTKNYININYDYYLKDGGEFGTVSENNRDYSFEELKTLCIDGVNKYWSVKNVKILGNTISQNDFYTIDFNLNETYNTNRSIQLKYINNTDQYFGGNFFRSHNVGRPDGILSNIGSVWFDFSKSVKINESSENIIFYVSNLCNDKLTIEKSNIVKITEDEALELSLSLSVNIETINIEDYKKIDLTFDNYEIIKIDKLYQDEKELENYFNIENRKLIFHKDYINENNVILKGVISKSISKNEAKIDFMYTSAHEIGHQILSTIYDQGYSFTHKGSSGAIDNLPDILNAVDQSPLPSSIYPKVGPIDIMKYYSDKMPKDYYERLSADSNDLIQIIIYSCKSIQDK